MKRPPHTDPWFGPSPLRRAVNDEMFLLMSGLEAPLDQMPADADKYDEAFPEADVW